MVTYFKKVCEFFLDVLLMLIMLILFVVCLGLPFYLAFTKDVAWLLSLIVSYPIACIDFVIMAKCLELTGLFLSSHL